MEWTNKQRDAAHKTVILAYLELPPDMDMAADLRPLQGMKQVAIDLQCELTDCKAEAQRLREQLAKSDTQMGELAVGGASATPEAAGIGELRAMVSELMQWVFAHDAGPERTSVLTRAKQILEPLPAPPSGEQAQLEQLIAKKSAEIEASGYCQWQYACPYCVEGYVPIPSSITEAMVHPDTPVGRVICEGRDKPTVFEAHREQAAKPLGDKPFQQPLPRGWLGEALKESKAAMEALEARRGPVAVGGADPLLVRVNCKLIEELDALCETGDDLTRKQVATFINYTISEFRKANLPAPPSGEQAAARHGIDCPKVEHVTTGYLHADDDDSPYDVDGLKYCGRCHYALPEVQDLKGLEMDWRNDVAIEVQSPKGEV